MPYLTELSLTSHSIGFLGSFTTEDSKEMS